VGYGDFLNLTLASAVRAVDRVTVVTAPWDPETPGIARKYGAEMLVTDAWRVRGAFNKARALNEWIESIDVASEETWLLTLDADILLPSAAIPRERLKAGSLYGAQRRMCADESDWLEYCAGARPLRSFKLEPYPLVMGRLWGTVQTQNPAGMLGYFQLWHQPGGNGGRRFREAPTASDYDVLFGLSFPETARHFLPEYEALHLGPARVNWSGRRSERWGANGLHA
jgi:hypothetical protein